MDAEQYERIQENIVNTYALRTERGRLARKATTYRTRALCLTEQLRRERNYRRCAEVYGDAMQAHAARVEQELMDALKMLARAGAALYECDGRTRNEQARPDPKLLNAIAYFVVQHDRS